MIFTVFRVKFTISKFTKIIYKKETKMYADKKKSQKVYVESKCVSRDDCCWDETPDTEVVVNSEYELKQEWPAHWKVIQ